MRLRCAIRSKSDVKTVNLTSGLYECVMPLKKSIFFMYFYTTIFIFMFFCPSYVKNYTFSNDKFLYCILNKNENNDVQQLLFDRKNERRNYSNMNPLLYKHHRFNYKR